MRSERSRSVFRSGFRARDRLKSRRQAVEGHDYDNQLVSLVGQLRNGKMSLSTAQLLVYCGHDNADLIVGDNSVCVPNLDKDWLSGLKLFGAEIENHVRVYWDTFRFDNTLNDTAMELAIEACQSYLYWPTAANRQALMIARDRLKQEELVLKREVNRVFSRETLVRWTRVVDTCRGLLGESAKTKMIHFESTQLLEAKEFRDFVSAMLIERFTTNIDESPMNKRRLFHAEDERYVDEADGISLLKIFNLLLLVLLVGVYGFVSLLCFDAANCYGPLLGLWAWIVFGAALSLAVSCAYLILESLYFVAASQTVKLYEALFFDHKRLTQFEQRLKTRDLHYSSLELAAFCGHRDAQKLTQLRRIPENNRVWLQELVFQTPQFFSEVQLLLASRQMRDSFSFECPEGHGSRYESALYGPTRKLLKNAYQWIRAPHVVIQRRIKTDYESIRQFKEGRTNAETMPYLGLCESILFQQQTLCFGDSKNEDLKAIRHFFSQRLIAELNVDELGAAPKTLQKQARQLVCRPAIWPRLQSMLTFLLGGCFCASFTTYVYFEGQGALILALLTGPICLGCLNSFWNCCSNFKRFRNTQKRIEADLACFD